MRASSFILHSSLADLFSAVGNAASETNEPLAPLVSSLLAYFRTSALLISKPYEESIGLSLHCQHEIQYLFKFDEKSTSSIKIARAFSSMSIPTIPSSERQSLAFAIGAACAEITSSDSRCVGDIIVFASDVGGEAEALNVNFEVDLRAAIETELWRFRTLGIHVINLTRDTTRAPVSLAIGNSAILTTMTAPYSQVNLAMERLISSTLNACKLSIRLLSGGDLQVWHKREDSWIVPIAPLQDQLILRQIPRISFSKHLTIGSIAVSPVDARYISFLSNNSVYVQAENGLLYNLKESSLSQVYDGAGIASFKRTSRKSCQAQQSHMTNLIHTTNTSKLPGKEYHHHPSIFAFPLSRSIRVKTDPTIVWNTCLFSLWNFKAPVSTIVESMTSLSLSDNPQAIQALRTLASQLRNDEYFVQNDGEDPDIRVERNWRLVDQILNALDIMKEKDSTKAAAIYKMHQTLFEYLGPVLDELRGPFDIRTLPDPVATMITLLDAQTPVEARTKFQLERLTVQLSDLVRVNSMEIFSKVDGFEDPITRQAFYRFLIKRIDDMAKKCIASTANLPNSSVWSTDINKGYYERIHGARTLLSENEGLVSKGPADNSSLTLEKQSWNQKDDKSITQQNVEVTAFRKPYASYLYVPVAVNNSKNSEHEYEGSLADLVSRSHEAVEKRFYAQVNGLNLDKGPKPDKRSQRDTMAATDVEF